jgi:hypothetical protein
MKENATSSLLRLPAEVHDLILKELPLSSHLLYKTQVCSALRMLFDGQISIPRSYRFDLVEWKRAQREVREILIRQDSIQSHLLQEKQDNEWIRDAKRRSIWDTSPTATPRPAPAKASAPTTTLYTESAHIQASQHKTQSDESTLMLVHHDHPEVSLFVRCMQFLGKINVDRGKGPLTRLRSDKITVLSLLSRSGFKVASLIQLLETQPSLSHVETVFMTSASFIDAILWTVFTPHQARQAKTPTRFSSDLPQSTCVDTAAIVIPGPLSEKGQGLRSGFKCLCFSSNSEGTRNLPFHVIFHDYYTEEEAIGTQNMLENSDISCNSCKQKIRF